MDNPNMLDSIELQLEEVAKMLYEKTGIKLEEVKFAYRGNYSDGRFCEIDLKFKPKSPRFVY